MATKLFCGCTSGNINGNTGLPSKSDGVTFNKTIAAYILPVKADDGTLNAVLDSDFVDGVLPKPFIEGKLNHTDPSKRWYPLNELEDVENVRGDRALSGAETGQNTKTTAIAVRTFSANIPDAGAVFLRNLERFSCKQYGVYLVDNCGALSGEVTRDNLTAWRPWRIAKRNFYPNLVLAQGDEDEMVNIQFEFDSKIVDSNREIIPPEHFGVDATESEGLINVFESFSDITATGVKATLTQEYGGKPNGFPQTGLVVSDFVLYNVTTGAPIVITSVTEIGPGVYYIVFPSQTALDVLELRQAVSGTQYAKFGIEFVVNSFIAV